MPPGRRHAGAKSAIATYLNYIIITSPPFLPSASSQSATVRNFVRDQRSGTAGAGSTSSSSGANASGSSLDASTDISKVAIFDPENKFVAYSGAFPEGVREVFAEWGEVYVLTNDSKLSRLVERPTMEKLGVLFSKNLCRCSFHLPSFSALYPADFGNADLLAVSLARTSGLEEGEVAEIYRKYGDHLYDKGDFDGAMQQFIKTVGKVQPSYVIRKVSAILTVPCRHVQSSGTGLRAQSGSDTLF